MGIQFMVRPLEAKHLALRVDHLVRRAQPASGAAPGKIAALSGDRVSKGDAGPHPLCFRALGKAN